MENNTPTLADLKQAASLHYQLNRPKSLKRFRTIAAHFERLLGADCPLEDLTYQRLLGYLQSRLNEGAAPATARHELAMLKRGWKELERAGISRPPCFPVIAVRNARQGFFEEQQIEAVIRHLPAYLRLLIGFLSLTGWRRGEATGLQWPRVNFEAQTVRLEAGETKNGRARLFPFGSFPELRQLLKDQRKVVTRLEQQLKKPVPWVFPRGEGYKFRVPLGSRIGNFRKLWARACAAAGCPGRLVHDLRRSAVRRLTRAGIARSIAKKLSGHLTDCVFERYDIVNEADLLAAVKKLSAFRRKQLRTDGEGRAQPQPSPSPVQRTGAKAAPTGR